MSEAQTPAGSVKPLDASRAYIDELSKGFQNEKLARRVHDVTDRAFAVLKRFDEETSKGLPVSRLTAGQKFLLCQLVDLSFRFQSREDSQSIRETIVQAIKETGGSRVVVYGVPVLGQTIPLATLVPGEPVRKNPLEIKSGLDVAIYRDIMGEVGVQFSSRLAPQQFPEILQDAIISVTPLRFIPKGMRHWFGNMFANAAYPSTP